MRSDLSNDRSLPNLQYFGRWMWRGVCLDFLNNSYGLKPSSIAAWT